MPLTLNKSMSDLMSIALSRLDNMALPNGKSITTKPGGVARLLLAVINNSLTDFYDSLQKAHLMSFLSTASDEGLDLIGTLVSCTRNSGELDDNFKARISQQVTALEAANELSVRLAVLSTNGVQDCQMKPFTLGTGSFSIFVISENGIITTDVVDAVRNSVDKVVAYGTKYEVTGPDLIPVEIGIKIIFTNGASDQDNVKSQVKDKIRTYLNSKKLQQSIIINEIIEEVMSVSEDIYDMSIYHFTIDSNPVLTTNQDCRWNERFIESPKPDSIMVA